MVDGKIEFLAGDSCSNNKGAEQWWEYGSMKDCYLTLTDDPSHLLRHKRGDDGRRTLLWKKRRRENMHGMM